MADLEIKCHQLPEYAPASLPQAFHCEQPRDSLERTCSMGQAWSSWPQQNQQCDLSDELVEEIHMITSLPTLEIHRIRRKYRRFARHEEMTSAEFYALPGIAVNPLRDCLFKTLELSDQRAIPFLEFAKFIGTFSYHSSQDAKAKGAFRIHDFDGDGRISREDLRTYLDLILQRPSEDDDTLAAERQDLIQLVVSRVMEEASSDPDLGFLTFEDFIKVQSLQYSSSLRADDAMLN